MVPVHKPSIATLVGGGDENNEVDISDSLRIPEIGRISPFGDLIPTHKSSYVTLVDPGLDATTISLDNDGERRAEIDIINADLEATSIVTVPVLGGKENAKFISPQSSEINTPDAPFLVTWDGPDDPDNPRSVARQFMFLNVSQLVGSGIGRRGRKGLLPSQFRY